MEEYKVLITTGGLGSRLGDITKYRNKSLVRVGKKPAISYVVESYPEEVPFVVTENHYGQQIKDFLRLTYPNRNFEFVNTRGSPSPGCSIWMAREKLDCPFIFHACDTIVIKRIPHPDINWVGGHKSTSSSQYRSFIVSGNKVIKMCEKGELDLDYIHIGLCGFKDYKLFWEKLELLYNEDKDNSGLTDVHIISEMLETVNFKRVKFPIWYDIGNIDGLINARNAIKETINVVEKYSEDIYMVDDHVIKFFHDKDIVEKRVKRSQLLEGSVPQIESHLGNFYKYKYIEGSVLSKKITVPILIDLFKWVNEAVWKKTIESNSESYNNFYDFYFNKTKERAKTFLKHNEIKDRDQIINGVKCKSVEECLELIDKDLLCNESPYQFHGDLILDNIIYSDDGKFYLIDWRQDFGGTVEYGDIYYDLSKLNHSFIFNHDMINDGHFDITVDDEIKFELYRKYSLACCQKAFYNMVKEYGYDIHKISIITSLIWLNMAALHTRPVNIFLWYFGQYNLNMALKSIVI